MEKNYDSNDGMTLVDCWRVLKLRKWWVCGFVGIVTLLAISVSSVMPKYYKAQATIMSVDGGGRGGLLSSLAGQFSGLASLAGVGGGSVSGQFIALLKTKTLAEDVINRLDLMPILAGPEVDKNDPLRREMAIQGLIGSIGISEEKESGTIKISAEYQDPQLATDIVNAYVDGLQRMINDSALTTAKRNRLFIEQQLGQNKRELLEAGRDISEFYKDGKVSNVESQVDVSIESATFGSGNIDFLNKKKSEIDEKLTVKNVPQQVYLQYLTLRRGLLSQINTLLSQQYEMAKINESRDDLAFQILDKAKVPQRKSRPRRTQIVVGAFVLSLFFSVFVAFFLEYIKKLTRNDTGEK